ncbi:hypothetical protein EDD94_7944 [Streptomyces sp. PanSC9]|nr:hypothetical protein EDD94_7944 [Streptomyces sp. PanSC9]
MFVAFAELAEPVHGKQIAAAHAPRAILGHLLSALSASPRVGHTRLTSCSGRESSMADSADFSSSVVVFSFRPDLTCV